MKEFFFVNTNFYDLRLNLRLEGQAKSNADANHSQEAESQHIPLYRLPQGLKRIELDKLKLPGNFLPTPFIPIII